MIICLDISYYGEPFSGFARQPGRLTVQGSLEEALKTIFNVDVETTCAGRTDAGVHAMHQFVSFESPKNDVELDKLNRSLNQLTHDDIHINYIKYKDDCFSARFSAKLRYYSYFICNQQNPSLFMGNTSWHIAKPLDVQAMQKAAQALLGEHDFKSFCVAKSAEDKTTMRNVSSIDIETFKFQNEEFIEIKISANAFLHSMVRTIVGTLVKVGLGQRDSSWVEEVLLAQNRQAAGECAPAKGLVLMDVIY